MGGFTNLFDRPDPEIARLTKNPSLQGQINSLGTDAGAAAQRGRGGLAQYIQDYIGGNAAAKANAAQETGAVNNFYNGNMARTLAGLRARQQAANNAAAEYGASRALASANRSVVGGDGAGGSYRDRLLASAVQPYYVKAAQDAAQQERTDTDYLTGNQLNLAGARTRIGDTLAQRDLQPYQVQSGMVRNDAGTLAPIISEDQANNFYGIKQKPGLLDRMQQEAQFLQGLQTIMKEQYGTAGEVAGGWAGGGGGGMGGMGSMGGFMRRGGLVRFNYDTGGGVHGPGTGTSDSIPARLSDGEFVVPASAVKIPGVLPWLEKIRKAGLVHEHHARRMMMGDDVPHMASGGAILYADSFGGLGNQALQRDMFNESVVSAGGSTGQYANQQQLADKSMQQQADAELLRYLSQRTGQNGTMTGTGGVGDGQYYQMRRDSELGRDIQGPLTQYPTYAHGGLVRHYAGGGPVWMGGNDSSAMLHNLAQEEYRRYMAGGMQPRVTPQSTAEQYAIAKNYAQEGELGPENIHLFNAVHPSTMGLLLDTSMRQRPEIERQYDLANALADHMTQRQVLRSQIADLEKKQTAGVGKHLLWNSDEYKQVESDLKDANDKLKAMPPDPTEKDPRLKTLVVALPTGGYQPAVKRPSWRIGTTAGTGNAAPSGQSATGTNAPALVRNAAPAPAAGASWPWPFRGPSAAQPAQVEDPWQNKIAAWNAAGNMSNAVAQTVAPPIDVQAQVTPNVQPADYEAAAYGGPSKGIVRGIPKQQVARMYAESRFGRIPSREELAANRAFQMARDRFNNGEPPSDLQAVADRSAAGAVPMLPEAVDPEMVPGYDRAPQYSPVSIQDSEMGPVVGPRGVPRPMAVPNTQGAMVTDFSNQPPVTYGRGGAPGATIVTARAPNLTSYQSPKAVGAMGLATIFIPGVGVTNIMRKDLPIALGRRPDLKVLQ